MFKGLFVLACSCLFLTNVCAQKIGFNINDGSRRRVIPFETYNNLILIPVILNDHLPLKFILDTGVSSSILFEKEITDLLGVGYLRKISILGVGEKTAVAAYVTKGVEIKLPGITGYQQSILALEEDYLHLKNQLGHQVHGILGYEIFSRFIVEINYHEKRLVLYDPARFKPKRRWEVLDMDLVVTKPYVNIEFSIDSGKVYKGNFLIDTGASHSIVIHPESEDHVRIPDKNIRSVLGRGLTGEVRGHLARIQHVKMGKYTFEEVIASFPDKDEYPDSISQFNKNGTIGGEILSRFRVVLDYVNEKIYLKKAGLVDDNFEYNMSGIELEAIGNDLESLRVTSIRKNSPAEQAGIKKNDIVLSINNVMGENLTLTTAYKFFNSKDGKRLRLEISRDGDKLIKRFQLKRVI